MTLQQLEREMVAQPIRSLQYMLNRLSLRYDFLPALVPDGVFGERTLEAVMLFQRELHPPVTGVVDRETWQAILDEWLDLERELADPRQIRAFPPSAKVQAGSSHNYLLPVQAMFQSLSHVLDGLEPESIDGALCHQPHRSAPLPGEPPGRLHPVHLNPGLSLARAGRSLCSLKSPSFLRLPAESPPFVPALAGGDKQKIQGGPKKC